jgi:hypothetical protein
VLQGIFGRKSDKITGGWKLFHNRELQLVLLARYYYNYQDNEDEMGIIYSMHYKRGHARL